MRIRFSIFAIVVVGTALAAGAGCTSNTVSPKDLLDKYFSSALRQDYVTTYACYYEAYKAKVNESEYVKHRKDASVLQAYKILSLKENGDTARAEVLLTFSPSEKLKRVEPVSITAKEDMVKEKGDWKIRVW
jgi:hypothetical protein